MNPSYYNSSARWNRDLMRAELTKTMSEALHIFQTHGNTDLALSMWRLVWTFGTPLLQQFVWRTLLINGILIGLSKSNKIMIEKRKISKLQAPMIGWFIGSNILRVTHKKEESDAYVDYELNDDGTVDLYVLDVNTDRIVPKCSVMGVRTGRYIIPNGESGFSLPKEI